MMDFTKKGLVVLLVLAFVRGALYAFAMPAWGLLDEEQHFDYILKISQTGAPPVTGRDYIDPQLAQNILETGRHAKFHWKTPKSADTTRWNLEGYSYEGYQGPLSYYLAYPFYALSPGGLLDRLFILRTLMVLASLATVWAAVRAAQVIYPQDGELPLWVGALVVSIPERTISTGRLTNDVLLEILAALFFWQFASAAMRGINWKRAGALGLLSGLGLITKISFAGLLVMLPAVYLIRLRDKHWLAKGGLTALVMALISVPFFLYSYHLYGDPTGYQGFADLYMKLGKQLWNPPFRLDTVMMASWQFFTSFWVVWWKGSSAITTPLLNAFWLAMLAAALAAAAGLRSEAADQYRENRLRFWVLAAFFVQVLSFLALSGVGYFQGKFPVIQGRFLLPVLFPIAFLFCLGLRRALLSQHWVRPRTPFVLLCALLLFVDAAQLFGNLLPYHYYESAFFRAGVPEPYQWPGARAAFSIFWANFQAEKPAWVLACFEVCLAAYAAILAWLLVRGARAMRRGQA